MPTYVALLRGIMPTNPNMKGEKLKKVFESLGFEQVATVIASGNVVFRSRSKDTAALESKIEKALPEKLGFKSTAMVRSCEDLERLAKRNPFKRVTDDKSHYPVVTFFKDRKKELCTALDVEKVRTTDFMRLLEQKHGKALTSRTWKTIGRILKKMDSPFGF